MMPEVNWLAVLVAAIASMILGFLWYGPLFGNVWMRMMGWDPNDTVRMEAMKKEGQRGYFIAIIGSLLTAYVLSHMVVFSQGWFDTSFLQAGLTTGFWIWLGFVAPVQLGAWLWEHKPFKFWVLNTSYNLVQLLIMGAILGSWR